MKKSIILVAVGIVFLISCIGNSEAFMGAVIIAALCFFFAYRSYKKEKQSQQSIQEANAAAEQLDVSTLTPVDYNDLVLKDGEEVYLAISAKTFTSKERVTGYEGGSSGVSVRVAKGVTVRSGGSKGTAVRKKVYEFHDGDYVVTNKRLVFIGMEDSFDIPLEKVTAVKQIATDAISIVSGNATKNMKIDAANAVYAHALTNKVINEFAK